MATENPAKQAEQEYQAESIRLAELRLQNIRSSIHAVERKAVLLISGCAALLSILFLAKLAASASNANAGSILHGVAEFLHLAAFVLLVVSIFLGEKVINLASVAATGLNPNVSNHFAMYYKNGDPSEVRGTFLLGCYQDGIQSTGQIQRAKAEKLETARNWLFAGFVCTMSRVFIIFYVL